jgi:hypothetical protein
MLLDRVARRWGNKKLFNLKSWIVKSMAKHPGSSLIWDMSRGGVTSPNGRNPPIGDPTGYQADLVKDETRIIASMIVRF